jgi:hypothetical protein
MKDPETRPFALPGEWVNSPESAAITPAPPSRPPASNADQVRRAHEAILRAIDGVLGVGTTTDDTGRASIVVYVRDADTSARLPRELDGVPVQPRVTGTIRAL